MSCVFANQAALGPLDATKGSLTSITSEDLLKLDQSDILNASVNSDPGFMKRSSSSSGLTTDAAGEDTKSLSAVEDLAMRISPERSSGAAVAALTEAQQKAITGNLLFISVL